jgi:uncharacterized protein with PQ loop repeat
MSEYGYLMYTASVLYMVCYVPELYANYKNKNANGWNVPEKVVILVGSTFALAYSIMLEDRTLMINYAPLFALDFIAFVMRAYYACKNCERPATVVDATVAAVVAVASATVVDVVSNPMIQESKELGSTTERECPEPQEETSIQSWA